MQSPHSWIWQAPDWPGFRWQTDRLIGALSAARIAQGKVLGTMLLLDGDLGSDAVAAILVEDGMTTSAIEGEALDVGSVRSSVARRLGLATAGLPTPPPAVDGLIEVLLDASQQHDRPLTIERLLGWHAALFPMGYSGLHRIRPGKWRGDEPMQVVSGRMGREHVHFEAPPRDRLENEVEHFLGWFNSPAPEVDGLIRAGLAHLWFVTLHPFEDGNGRLARVITDMALCQDEKHRMRVFSLSAQILREREAYYDLLERTQRNGLEVTDWLAWFLRQVEASAALAEETIGQILSKARFWLKHQDLELTERQRKVLNRMLDAGPGGFLGGMNTRKYVGMTHSSRATAYRDLTDLVEKGCLRPSGQGGRSSGYEIVW